MSVFYRGLFCIAATVALAIDLSAQAPPVVPSNISGNLPAIPVFRIPASRALNTGERQVLDRMIQAAEEYVRRNPIYAVQLVRFRDVRDSDRVRRADLSDLDGDGKDELYPRWLTLADEYLQLPSGRRVDVWVPPGGVLPNTDDILPPNTLLVHDGQLDWVTWCDPSLHCYFRALAIVIAIHEGGRQMNEGLKSEDVAECTLLERALNVFRVDKEIWNDLLTNGVPVPGEPNCEFPEANFQLLAKSELKGAEDDFNALCKDLEKLGCPKPADCP